MPAAPTTRKTRATHGSLVEAAREVVRRTGTLIPEMVADTAGVSPATLYAYFGSKDAILAAAFEAALDEMGDAVGRVLSVEKLLENGWEAISEDLVRTVVKRFTHDARVVRLAVARLPDSSEVREVYRRKGDDQLAMIARFLRLGIAAGKLRAGNVDVLSKALMVHLQGLQNPLVLATGAGAVVEEMVAVTYRMLATSE